jgi:hypothetical protein
MRALFFIAAFLIAPQAWALETTTSLLFQSEGRLISDSKANPGNRVARLPARLVQVEGRVDANYSLPWLEIVARPRVEAGLYWVNGVSENSAAGFFQEAYLRAPVTEDFSITAGRLQFGWGPAESVSPSNWMVPEIQWQPSPYYEQLGVYRVQANLSAGQDFSLILINEFQPLPDRLDSRSEVVPESFRKRALAKAEWSWDSGNYILGFTGGRERLQPGELWRGGAYGSITISDAWQIYGDGVARETANTWKSFSVLGVRYTAEGGAEFRLEGIHRGEGLTRDQRANQALLFSRANDSTLAALLAAQFERLQGREYAYAAFRWANPPFLPGNFQTPILFLRALHSLSDHSTSFLGGVEVGFLGYFSTTLYGAVATGPTGGELKNLYDGMFGVAGKVTF